MNIDVCVCRRVYMYLYDRSTDISLNARLTDYFYDYN